jgi:hypothetical protein
MILELRKLLPRATFENKLTAVSSNFSSNNAFYVAQEKKLPFAEMERKVHLPWSNINKI